MQEDLHQLHDEFARIALYSRNVSPETLRGYRASFALLMQCSPRLGPADISADALHRFFTWLNTRERRLPSGEVRVGVKPSTVATYWNKLSPFFDWLKARGTITRNPLREDMQGPRVRYEDKKYITRAKLEKILVAIGYTIPWQNNFVRTRNVAIVTVAVNCGLRKGELFGLRLTDLDLERKHLLVRSETSKSRRQRRVPLNEFARQKILDYLAERRERRHATEFLWASDNRDGPFTEDGFRRVQRVIIEKTGLRFHLHQMRHTFAVNYLHNGGNVAMLQKLLGHESITSTALYTRCIPTETARGEIERLGDLHNALAL